MKILSVFLFLLLLVGCKSDNKITPEETETTEAPEVKPPDIAPSEKAVAQKYSNERFRDVTVTADPNGDYIIEGKAQVFEASFSWTIEDGHNQLAEGHEMTDAGAPEFGNFSFKVKLGEVDPNSVPHLILYESSPKDGSRQYELPIPLN